MDEVVPLAGRYRFLRKLRGASSGVVWLAADERTGDTVVVSSVTSARTAGLKKGVGLVHDGLATLLDVFERVPAEQIPGRMVLRAGMSIGVALDVSGRTLQERLNLAGPLDPLRAVRLTRQVVSALAHLHRHGAVHGAVSTQSVVIVRVGGQVIPILSNLRVAAVGSFCSPERIGGAGPSTHDDAWGACVLLFTALTANTPFEGHSREQLMQAMTSGQPPQLANHGVHDAMLQTVIDRGFSADARVRFATAMQFEQALAAWSPPDTASSLSRLSMADIAIDAAPQDDSVQMSEGAAALSQGAVSSSDDDGTDLDDDEIATMAIDVNKLREQMQQRAEASINSTVGVLTSQGQRKAVFSGVAPSTVAAVPTVARDSAPSSPSVRTHAPPLRLNQSLKAMPSPARQGARQLTKVGLAPAASALPPQPPGQPPPQPPGQQNEVPKTGLLTAPTPHGGAPPASSSLPKQDTYTGDDDDCATTIFNPSTLLAAVFKEDAAAPGHSPSVPQSSALPTQQPVSASSRAVSQPFCAPVVPSTSGVSVVPDSATSKPVPAASIGAGVPSQHATGAALAVSGPVLAPGTQGAAWLSRAESSQPLAIAGGKELAAQEVVAGEGFGGAAVETKQKRGVFATFLLVFAAAIGTVLVAVIAFVVALVVMSHATGQRDAALSAYGGKQDAGVEASSEAFVEASSEAFVEAASGADNLTLAPTGRTNNTDNINDAASSEGGDTAPNGVGGASVGADGDAGQGKQNTQDVSACVVQFFPENSFALPVSMGFVCTEANYQKIAQALHLMIVQGGRGIVTQAMRTWALLGWYELAVVAVLQQSCCSARSEPSAVKPSTPCEDLDTVLRKVAKGGCSKQQMEQRTEAVAEAIGCYFKHHLPRPYPNFTAPPRPHNRQAFIQFLGAIDPSRCAKTAAD